MKKFAYKNAGTIPEAVSLTETGNAAVLAGGTDLINRLKAEAYDSPPELLVNIKDIPSLDSITEDADGLKIGALTRIKTVADSGLIRSTYPALADAAGVIAAPAIRQMSTLAGNLCQEVQCWYFRRSFMTGNTFHCLRKGGSRCYAVNGDNRYHAILGAKGCHAVCPSDLAVALTALDARVVTSKRSMPIDDFFEVMGNTLEAGEIVTGVEVPEPAPGTGQSFIKFALRPVIDFAVVSAASVITVSDGKVSDARIVLGAVAPVPYRATGAEEVVKGKAIDEPVAEEAADAAVRDAVPLSHNRYKVRIAKTLVKRAIMSCI